MKRKLSLLLLAMIVLSLCACAEDKPVITQAATETTLDIQNENSATPPTVPELSATENEEYYSACTYYSKAEVEAFAKKIKGYILEKDWKSLSESVSYPISIGEHSCDSKDSFAKGEFADLLNEQFFDAVENESCVEMFCNWQGIMLGNGEVWIAELDGLKVIAINAPNQIAITASTMEDILAGEGSFYSQADNLYMTLEGFCANYDAFGKPAHFTRYAIADVNANGKDEVILWLSTEGDDINPCGEPFKVGVLILSEREEQVEGHFVFYHDLYDLKADGTYRWYGKHGSSGIAYMDSSDSLWCRREIATEEKKDYSSPDNTMIHHADRAAFSLDETISDEEAYRQAMKIQEAKENVHWMDYPCETLGGLLGGT